MSNEVSKDQMMPESGTLGIVASMYAWTDDEEVRMHLSFGRVVDRLSTKAEKACLCVPIRRGECDPSRDYVLQNRDIELIAQPYYLGSMDALKSVVPIVMGYWRVCRRSDYLFIRGMIPYVGLLYLCAFLCGLKPCHWLVGDSVAMLKSHRRAGRVKDMLSLAYAMQDRLFTKLGRWVTGGCFLCNGEALAGVYASNRTTAVVSSTVCEDEFFEREDTCQGETLRILFIGFIRPEKGVEYLIEAMGRLGVDRPWELVLVGSSGKYTEYHKKLEAAAERGGIGDRISWQGYVGYGEGLWRCLREADVFVLPTLSEGTPRVLVEARANSVPIVSTTVGGIPTSVTDEVDGLLVAPKDSVALANAIRRIIVDGELRRGLIRNGLRSARQMTVDCFVARAWEAIGSLKVKGRNGE